ncbi:MAG: MFS transporter [Methanoregula sp.]|nr:MFS transporter [Methanoregula sp.]
MSVRFTLFTGIFAVMALSNAIVPVLPGYAPESTWQGAIYSAYFLGAFVTTLPAGILSERYGRVPVIRVGLLLTVISGFLLFVIITPVSVVILRCLEGAGAGFFVAAALAQVNSGPDHARMSGIFMAMLNGGLVTGLIASGWLAVYYAQPAWGILIFSGLASIAAVTSIFISTPRYTPPSDNKRVFLPLLKKHRWLWYSSVVLIGITGVVTSLYPKFSGESPYILGAWIAGMSIATIMSVLVTSQASFSPVTAIRWSAVLMIGGVIISFVTPLGFVILGTLAGVVMIAQMAFLAEAKDYQGVAMGLFTTASYCGMTVLPILVGVIADWAGFFSAFCVTAILAGSVAITIGWCGCRSPASVQ